MKSKIEKIEVEENLRKIVSASGQDTLLLVDKINEIIDHLNSQDQEEEKEVPIMQVTDGGFTHWVADTHIEEYPKEPTQDITEEKWLEVKEAIENLTKEDLFTWLQDVLVFPEWEDTPEEKTVEERMKEMEIPYMETAKLEELNENERRKRDKLAMDMLDNAYKLHYVKDTPEEWVGDNHLNKLLVELLTDEKLQGLVMAYRFTPSYAVAEKLEAMGKLKQYLYSGIKKEVKQLLEDKEEESWKEIHDMLKPFHLEGEHYAFTLKRILDKLNNKKK